MYTKPAFVAAALGTVATVGWVIQGVGNALYYRQVNLLVDNTELGSCSLFDRFGRTTRARATRWRRYAPCHCKRSKLIALPLGED